MCIPFLLWNSFEESLQLAVKTHCQLMSLETGPLTKLAGSFIQSEHSSEVSIQMLQVRITLCAATNRHCHTCRDIA